MVSSIPFEASDWSALTTPCFVFDEPELRDNFNEFQSALEASWSHNAHVAYSVKTNPLPWIVEVARQEGALAEVVSGDEFQIALQCGYDASDVVFNGPAKTRDWLRYALTHHARVNLDSVRDIAWAAELAGQGNDVAVGIRANVDLEALCPGETLTGQRGGRFGFGYENGELKRALSTLIDAGVRVCGLHMHVTTASRSQRVYEALANQACQIAHDYALDLDWIDMGGGFYGGGQRNEGAYEAYAHTMASVLKHQFDPERTTLIVEPGGAVVCTPGRYVGKVVDVKQTPRDRFVTCELSRVNIDHEMKKTSYPLHLLTQHASTCTHQVLCGFTCMESDRLCELVDQPELACGDTVVIDFAGAYSMSFTPQMFIERPPAVYARAADGTCTLIRPSSRAIAPDEGTAS